MGQSIQKETGTKGKTIRPFGMRDKFGYLFGDFGNDFFFILVARSNGILHRCISINPAMSGYYSWSHVFGMLLLISLGVDSLIQEKLAKTGNSDLGF